MITTSELLLLEYALWPSLAEQVFGGDTALVVIGHPCTDGGCGAIATWRCFWPGQDAAKCTAHRDAWARLAEFLGFSLASKPLEVRQWPEPDPSAARFAAMELY